MGGLPRVLFVVLMTVDELVVSVSALFDAPTFVLPVLRLRVVRLLEEDSSRIDSSALAMTFVSVSSS